MNDRPTPRGTQSEDMADQWYSVTVWYYRSEHYYSFMVKGPHAVDEFISKVDKYEDREVTGVTLLNPPDDFGTGMELG